MTAPIVFGVTAWCRLLAHACTAGEVCGCECHARRAAPRRSTALHRLIPSGDAAR